MVGGLYVRVEGVGGGHVPEGGGRRGVYGQAEGEDGYLGELGAGGEVVGAEGVVGVAGDDAVAVEVADGFVEVVGGVYIGEGHRTRG